MQQKKRVRTPTTDDFDRERERMEAIGLSRFTGKFAVVTGGASGIGRATVSRFLAEGASVWIVDMEEPAAEEMAFKGLHHVQLDVSDETAVDDAMAQIASRAGQIDVVVNAAGIVAPGSATDTTLADWLRINAVNLTGTFLVTRAAMRAMKRSGGAIINVSSDAGLVGQTGQAAYCASKGGVVQFTKAAALDGAPDGIRVNCVCPCFIATPMVEDWLASQPDPGAARQQAEAEQPIGRMGRPEEIAAAIAYLGSHEANFVTGIALSVDGGTTAR